MSRSSDQASGRSRVVAVIVTHDRLEHIAECLEAVRVQTHPVRSIVVVDNASTDGTAEYLRRQEDLVAMRLLDNRGGAGGFDAGLRVAVDSDADWLWLLDDDCIAARTCLQRLLQAAHVADDGRLGGVSPGVGPHPDDVVVGFLRNPAGTVRTSGHHPTDAALSPRAIDWAAFAGLLLRRAACEQTGAIRADFFLWNDDTEYCLRMGIRGWRLLGEPSAFVEHPAATRIYGRVFGREMSIRQASPAREFLGVRNLIYVDWLYRKTEFKDGRSLAWRVGHEMTSAVKVLVLDRSNGPARAAARSRGIAAALSTIILRRSSFKTHRVPGEPLPTAGTAATPRQAQ